MCSGLYCRPCLETHFDEGKYNTCPLHDTAVLFAIPRKPRFVPGARITTNTLDQIPNSGEAQIFVGELWRSLQDLYQNERIYDSDIEDHINKALILTAERCDYSRGPSIKKEH
jgi:hypothetical protein